MNPQLNSPSSSSPPPIAAVPCCASLSSIIRSAEGSSPPALTAAFILSRPSPAATLERKRSVFPAPWDIGAPTATASRSSSRPPRGRGASSWAAPPRIVGGGRGGGDGPAAAGRLLRSGEGSRGSPSPIRRRIFRLLAKAGDEDAAAAAGGGKNARNTETRQHPKSESQPEASEAGEDATASTTSAAAANDVGHENGYGMSEVASEDLFDDVDFTDAFLLGVDAVEELDAALIDDEEDLEKILAEMGDDAGDVDLDDDGGGDLDEILAEMEEGDFLVLADDDEEEDDDADGDDRGGPFVVASEELDDEEALLFAELDDLGDGGDDDGDELDDDELLELLSMDDEADPDDLVELERLLAQKRKIDDALDLRRILGPQREVSVSLSTDDDENAAMFNAERWRAKREGTSSELEKALLQGVVPADAGVGSGSLPGDFGFDPLELSTKDYFRQTQRLLLGVLPKREEEEDDDDGRAKMEYDGSAIPRGWRVEDLEQRPPALILRDYREAEIRHGRLAMLAAVFWPLQEIADRLFIPGSFGHTTVIYGGPTLPFFSLLMTAIMLLLGYLDIYAAAIKDEDAGEAFLPGECFWDPLRMLDGAPDSMKRNMQERELNNGRMAMVAVAAYVLEEAITHRPLVSLPFNEFLFEPAYQIPAVQAWLDRQFQTPSPTFTFPEVGTVDFVETLKEVLEEEQQQEAGGGAVAADVAADVAAGLDGVVRSSTDLYPDSLLK